MKKFKLLRLLIYSFLIFVIGCNAQEPSKLVMKNLSDRQVENLYKVGKVWGFLKYYHPEILNGKFDWDYELVRILPEVTDENADVNQILMNQIDKLGTITPRNTTRDTCEIKLLPDLNWINDSEYLGIKLSGILKDVKNSARPKNNYYVDFVIGIGNPNFKNENTYSNLSYDDDGIKLVGLFRYWNIIRYYYPYRNLIDENWDEVLKTFIPKIISADDELSYKLTLLELIGKVSDTHANIWSKEETLNRFWGLKAVPVEIKILNNQVVVTKIYDELEENADIKLGDIITHINGEVTEKLIDEKIKYCPASNLPTQLRDVSRKLLRTNDDSIELKIKHGETIVTKRVNCIDFDQIKFWENKTPSYKILDNNIGYIFPGSLQKGEIDSIMSVLANTKGLIVDFRCYPSDFIVFSFCKILSWKHGKSWRV
ncbi:MAG TPA: hypothetical protein PLH53_07540 [Ignavibacteriaceae bacterium]|nr:hypothetical protein [Ignavibacteriaceae bacterium]